MPKIRKILIIDDEKDLCNELLSVLQTKYRIVSYVLSCKEAKDYISKNLDIDLVLLDLKLPDCDGLDLIKQIKRANDSTIIIVITAYGTYEATLKAIREQVYDFFNKPFDPKLLEKTVEEAINKRELENNLHEKMEVLKSFSKAAGGREERIVELKNEIKDLKKEIELLKKEIKK